MSGHPMCRLCGKRTYPDERTASFALRRVESGRPLRVYRCPISGGWHLSHQTAKWRRRWV